jgi:ribosomal protein S18 acetylase RimI-like enzyme
VDFELKGEPGMTKPYSAFILGIDTKPQYRNQGWATMILKVLTRYFDSMELPSALVAKPDKEGGLKMKELQAFYRKFGYKVLREVSAPGEALMVREKHGQS